MLRVPITSANGYASAFSESEWEPEQSMWLRALELRLGYENWMPLNDDELLESYLTANSVYEVHHWQLGQLNRQLLKQQLLKTSDDKSESDTQKEAIEEDVRLIKFAEKLLLRERSEDRNLVDAYLRKLSKRDDLVGVNAKILFAQRKPTEAVHLKNDLKSIMIQIDKYQNRDRPVETTSDAESNRETLVNHLKKMTKNVSPRSDSDVGEPEVQPETRNVKVSSSTSLAAAEAWCHVLAQTNQHSEQAFVEPGRLLQKVWLNTDLRIQLYRTLAMKIAPTRLPRLNVTLERAMDESRNKQIRSRLSKKKPAQESPDEAPISPELIEGIVDACRIQAAVQYSHWLSDRQAMQPESADHGHRSKPKFQPNKWPTNIGRAATHEDPRVRRLYVDWVAYSGHPSAVRKLELLANDNEVSVRTKAIEKLGIVENDEAKELLELYAQDSNEQIRMSAMSGILQYDIPHAMALFQDDESRSLKAKMARLLASKPSPAAAKAMEKLVLNRAVNVQMSVLEGVASWPDELAFPVLVAAIVEGTLSAREMAYVEIQSRREVPEDIAIADLHRREERMRMIQAWAHQYNLPVSLSGASATNLKNAKERRQQDRTRLLEALSEWKQASGEIARELHTDELKGLVSREHLQTIRAYLRELEPEQREALIEKVLAPTLAEFQAIQDLDSRDVHARRRAASQLMSLSDQFSLSPLALEELLQQMQQEQDKLVWLYVMSSINGDVTDDGTNIAILAIQNQWPDVQVLGCEYLGKHRIGRLAHLLIPLFEHPHVSVRIAAVRAAGQCENPIVMRTQPGQKNLLTFLNDPRSEMRLATVISLAQLNHPIAVQELYRLSLDRDPDVRLLVAKGYGETKSQLSIRRLIQMGRVENKYKVLAEIHQSLLGLVPESTRPVTIRDQNNPREAVKLWVEWFDADVEKTARNIENRDHSVQTAWND